MPKQRTIAATLQLGGIGVHAGTMSLVTMSPAPCDTGVIFRDARSGDQAPALISHVAGHRFQTSISSGELSLGTIEHLMAALAAMEVDNAYVTVQGSEIPIMDGSSRAWVDGIKRSGTIEQAAARRRIRILKTIRVEDGPSWCMLSPGTGQGFRMSYDLVYGHPGIGHQSMALDITPGSFDAELADARTFGFLEDLPLIRSLGLAQGASTSNTVVFSSAGLINEEGLRWANEPARHKLVDALGDLFLLGHRIIGEFRGHLSGHALNQELVRSLISRGEDWCFE